MEQDRSTYSDPQGRFQSKSWSLGPIRLRTGARFQTVQAFDQKANRARKFCRPAMMRDMTSRSPWTLSRGVDEIDLVHGDEKRILPTIRLESVRRFAVIAHSTSGHGNSCDHRRSSGLGFAPLRR